jgi:hypothetical protein
MLAGSPRCSSQTSRRAAISGRVANNAAPGPRSAQPAPLARSAGPEPAVVSAAFVLIDAIHGLDELFSQFVALFGPGESAVIAAASSPDASR